jgi:hypothetical protein
MKVYTGSAWVVAYVSGGGFLSTTNNLSELTATASTARTNIGLGTGDSPQFTAVNIGNASDTTVTRASAGVIAVEGSNVLMASNIGSSVQAYDSNLTSFVGVFTLPTSDGTNGQVIQTNGSGTLSFATPSSGGVTTGKAIAMAMIFGF